jgi:Raf kinase inhibitor-like YbhB/YbcL family protein
MFNTRNKLMLYFVFWGSLFGINAKKRCALEPCKEEITVISPSFIDGGKIDKKHSALSCQGQNVPFDIKWTQISEAKSYLIIIDDPDAPSRKHPRTKPFVHAVYYDIPANALSLNKNNTISSIGAIAGLNDFGNTQFDGPCPPAGSGTHRYYIKVYALNITSLELKAGATKEQVLEKAHKHIIGQGQTFGTYER